MNESVNAFLDFENKEFIRSMDLVQFYEVAEELILSLQYFNLKQKEENMFERLNSQEKFNAETDKMCIICLDNPNDIVLGCSHSY